MLSIDPGVHFCGVARWSPSGRLTWAGLVKTSELNSLERDEVVVIEKPQKDRRTGRVRMKDIINLSVAAGLAGEALVKPGGSIVYYTPFEWKRNLPKGVTHDRLQGSLTETELGTIVLPKNKKGRTDVLDSVALGLAHMRKTGVRMGKCFV